MKYLIQQTEILNKIANILSARCPDGTEHSSCDFQIFGERDEKTASSKIRYSLKGRTHEGVFGDEFLFDVTDYAVDLHNLMEDKTGIGWTSFTLTLDKNGKAHTKFEYPDQGG